MKSNLRLQWHLLALDDLDRYEAWGEKRWSPEVARNNREKLIQAARLLTYGTLTHRKLKLLPDVYGYYVPKTSFWIYYQIEGETLKVLRYWHTSRDKITRSDFDFSES